MATSYQVLAVAVDDEERALKAASAAAKQAKQDQEELARSVGQVADRLLGAIQNADSFTDALKNVGIELLRLAVQDLTGNGSSQLIGSIGSSALSIIGGFFANGAAFQGGRVVPFASGGVVTGPTNFPMAGGNIGLMGEAGPEAIMPLKRGPGGRLGVQASGMGRTVQIVQHNTTTISGVVPSEFRKIVKQQADKSGQEAVAALLVASKEDRSILR